MESPWAPVLTPTPPAASHLNCFHVKYCHQASPPYFNFSKKSHSSQMTRMDKLRAVVLTTRPRQRSLLNFFNVKYYHQVSPFCIDILKKSHFTDDSDGEPAATASYPNTAGSKPFELVKRPTISSGVFLKT